ncbi:phytanoyl-CoA dioxygenase family protein [Pseudomonas citronellolis]|uniref:phytanoyl-CoA dioxygenase family protein n=1 Tax=Pseudomonas citronellolis TaxID=53408 RepID=UPI0020A1BB3C|nr:phytanoyl-CoA dioxygenase family protein [Pseudomonas citronellolis]MCP1603583.1 ectoine hydroxylase-related dioxygenase (phytanoyl-CoA dioxygenase family) [Pseudomonas citronellolis]MCP1653350.1 ectoine hydroxylase-related dioxygenase (phytanoyl-CoA dioxygenase family) [Pseudomonas citronellolis]MCP1720330.1 ectoine hydroxylase-related dioxygenase (phytanoyl-CoA dioxygenase family) [Pseudomonas citronellolis]
MDTKQLTTLDSSEPVERVVEVIKRDGGVIIANFISGQALEALAGELDKYLNETPFGEDAYFAGTQTRRVARLVGRSDRVVEVALNPLFIEPAKQILQTPTHVWSGDQRVEVAPNIQLSFTQAIQICPGQGLQPLHRDDATSLWRHPQYGREARLQIMLAISDFTEENGATRVIPGSHTWDDERMPTQEETVPAEMAAGSALLWMGSVYHGGGANKSDRPRTGLSMAYDLAFLRSEENHLLSIPIDRVRQLPEEMQRLLGWGASQTFLGWVEIDGQMREPRDLLDMPSFTEVGKGF